MHSKHAQNFAIITLKSSKGQRSTHLKLLWSKCGGGTWKYFLGVAIKWQHHYIPPPCIFQKSIENQTFFGAFWDDINYLARSGQLVTVKHSFQTQVKFMNFPKGLILVFRRAKKGPDFVCAKLFEDWISKPLKLSEYMQTCPKTARPLKLPSVERVDVSS